LAGDDRTGLTGHHAGRSRLRRLTLPISAHAACLAQIAVLERKLAQTQEALAELRAICGLSGDPRSDRR